MKRIIAVILLVAIGITVGGGSVLVPAPRMAYAGDDSVYEDVGKVVIGLLILKALFGICQDKVIIVPHREGYELKLAGDPTLGYFQNRTRNWYIFVWIDDLEEPILVRPGGWKQEVHMDIGIHKIRAKAYAHTYYGDRLVGIYGKDFKVDGRMREKRYGWRIIFSEWSFRSPPPDQE